MNGFEVDGIKYIRPKHGSTREHVRPMIMLLEDYPRVPLPAYHEGNTRIATVCVPARTCTYFDGACIASNDSLHTAQSSRIWVDLEWDPTIRL